MYFGHQNPRHVYCLNVLEETDGEQNKVGKSIEREELRGTFKRIKASILGIPAPKRG